MQTGWIVVLNSPSNRANSICNNAEVGLWRLCVRAQTTHQVLRTSAGLDEALGDVPRVAQRVWTSDQLFCPCRREFCSMLNTAIRADDPALLAAVEETDERKVQNMTEHVSQQQSSLNESYHQMKVTCIKDW